MFLNPKCVARVFRLQTRQTSGLLIRLWAAGGDSVEIAVMSGRLRLRIAVADRLQVTSQHLHYLTMLGL